jgi:polysaccharide export outer membrane protein
MLKKLYLGAAMVTALFLLIACGASQKNHQQRILLQGIDTANELTLQIPDPKIKNGDLLTILIYSDNKEATDQFNQAQSGGAANATVTSGPQVSSMGRGYFVDNNGEIRIHKIGEIKSAGLTCQQLADELEKKLTVYLLNPYVIVRFANARITVLGEVTRPGVIDLPGVKVSIFDAIGFAGDFTNFSRRDNILVVREIEGKRVSKRLDLRNPDVYNSEFFYLGANDLVYIEPTRRKPTGNEQVLLRNVTIGSSIVSVVVLIISIIRR